MNRYNKPVGRRTLCSVTIKRIGLALVWLANVATILGWSWLAIHHWPH
jgi:hypothetical protein